MFKMSESGFPVHWEEILQTEPPSLGTWFPESKPGASNLTRSMAAPSSLLLAMLLWVPAETLTCIGDSGKPVDW